MVLGTTATQRLWGYIESQKGINPKTVPKRTIQRLKTGLAAQAMSQELTKQQWKLLLMK